MNYSKGFEVKLPEKQIVLTKDFARKLSDITSMEYAIFMQLRSAYPAFAVVKYTINQKKDRKKCFKLSYEEMETLIAKWEPEDPKTALEEFKSKTAEAKCCDGSYGIVKKWFLNKYGKQYENIRATGNANN